MLSPDYTIPDDISVGRTDDSLIESRTSAEDVNSTSSRKHHKCREYIGENLRI